MPRHPVLRGGVLLLAVAFGACGDSAGPDTEPRVALSIDPEAASVALGGTAIITATIVRGGFTGPVTIGASGAPAGVTVTGGTIPSGATTLQVSIAAEASATVGSADISITGSAPGLTIAPAALDLTVAAGPFATLAVNPLAVAIEAGQSGTVSATITRGGGFTGPVTIETTGAPADVTVTGGTIAAGSTAIDVEIVTTTSAARGTVSLSITGSATGVTIAPAAVALTVTGQIGQTIEGENVDDAFGEAAALSADGSRLIVGAPLNNGAGGNSGHARVYERSGESWVQLGEDLDGEAAGDNYGEAVAISDDGTRIAVGAGNNGAGGFFAGHVRVFDYVGGAWVQVGGDIDGGEQDHAGEALAMSASGHRVVIGGSGAGSGNGVVRVWEFVGGAWTQVGGTFAGDSEFHDAVAMSDDGNRIAIGAPLELFANSKPGYTSVSDWNGTAWTRAGANIEGEALGDGSGSAVALSADGSTLAVGAENNDGAGQLRGHVRVHRFTGGSWIQVGGDIDGPAGEFFGRSVSISADGIRVFSLSNASQSAGIYDLVGGTWIRTFSPDFGVSDPHIVALSADGKTGALGGPLGASGKGEVRVYQLP